MPVLILEGCVVGPDPEHRNRRRFDVYLKTDGTNRAARVIRQYLELDGCVSNGLSPEAGRPLLLREEHLAAAFAGINKDLFALSALTLFASTAERMCREEGMNRVGQYRPRTLRTWRTEVWYRSLCSLKGTLLHTTVLICAHRPLTHAVFPFFAPSPARHPSAALPSPPSLLHSFTPLSLSPLPTILQTGSPRCVPPS